jgi:hypothetical protein
MKVGSTVTLRSNVLREIKQQSGNDISKLPYRTAKIIDTGGMGGFVLDRPLYGYKVWMSKALIAVKGNLQETNRYRVTVEVEARNAQEARRIVTGSSDKQRTNPLKSLTREDAMRMTPSRIQAAQVKLAKDASWFTKRMIETGRGNERPSEWLHANDKLAQFGQEVSRQQGILHEEVEARMGPGYSRISVGRGFGPRLR